MELDKQQYVQAFLNLVKTSNSKVDFIRNAQQFDNKFTEAFQTATLVNKASYESFASIPQVQVPPQRPRNPFINTTDEQIRKARQNYSPARMNNFINQTEILNSNTTRLLNNNQNKLNASYSRSEHDFYKPPQASRTYHGGFGGKEFEKPNYSQEFEQVPSKGPVFAWQMNEGYFQPRDNFQQQTRQNYSDIKKMFNNFNLVEQKYMNPNYNNPNQLPIQSNNNFNSYTGYQGQENHPNEFYASLGRDQDQYAKFQKRPVYLPNRNELEGHNQYMINANNPFARR